MSNKKVVIEIREVPIEQGCLFASVLLASVFFAGVASAAAAVASCF